VRRLDEVERPGPTTPEAEDTCRRAREQFTAALADDLNAPEALAAVHGLVVKRTRSWRRCSDRRRRGGGAGRARLDGHRVRGIPALGRGSALGLRAGLFDERQAARQRRDFKAADVARAELEALGVVLEDTVKGTRWRRRR